MFDFPRFARDRGIPTASSGHHHCHNGWIQTHCPFCTDGAHGFHLGWNIRKGNMSCWRCGGISLYRYLTTVVPETSAKALWAQYSTDKPPQIIVPKKIQNIPVRKRHLKAPNRMKSLGRPHLNFLKSRGFRDIESLVEEWEIWGTNHLAPSLWRWRVVSPVKDKEGQVVSYVGRSVGKNCQRKYVYSSTKDMNVDPKTMLYGIHWAMGDYVLIVEGPIDVWKLGPGAVATNGMSWSREQLLDLRRYNRRFVLFDPEPRALKKALQLAESLSIFSGQTEVITGLETDPGDMTISQVRKLRKYLGV